MRTFLQAFWGSFMLCSLIGCGPSPDIGEWWVNGVYESRISLNGEWKFNNSPPEDFWSPALSTREWADIQVPGECSMQGFAIQHDQTVAYRRRFLVPADFKDKKVVLQFDGVYSHAQVWINGQFIREHIGGFTRWACDITSSVRPGEEAVLAVAVVDPRDDISYASGYAKHPIGGILRDVWLKALPINHLTGIQVTTNLDTNYQNALLNIKAGAQLVTADSLMIRFELLDPVGQTVIIEPDFLVLKGKRSEERNGQLSIPITQPLLWDAEHPNLYTLRTLLIENGRKTFAQSERIGFREIERDGKKLRVNGREVKLRGACRHDLHPLLGRMTTPALDQQDVLLAKEANMNFIRTSHYPPSEAFLRYCDEYGLYVEDETAVCFVDAWRMPEYKPHTSQNDPTYLGHYLGQLTEMVEAHRNHPSVIIWSLGNESFYGNNFRQSFEYLRHADPTRPIIFSYPGTVTKGERPFDIGSLHYPEFTGHKEEFGVQVHHFSHPEYPMLYDEYAHVACFNREELQEDPNVRNLWGQSLDTIWTQIFDTDGALGGAIRGFIDETFMIPAENPGFRDWWGFDNTWEYPGPTIGYGEWGIIDSWRRKKPEFWHTKKAYSPTKILQTTVDSFVSGQPLRLPIYNRFDHTDLSEVQIRWVYGKKAGRFRTAELPPHQYGTIEIPAQKWQPGTLLEITFFDATDRMIDTYAITLKGMKPAATERRPPGTEWTLEESDSSIFSFTSKKLVAHFRTSDGLLAALIANGDTLLQTGPFLQYRVRSLQSQELGVFPLIDLATSWQLDSLHKTIDSLGVPRVALFGHCDTFRIDYTIIIGPPGQLNTRYTLHNPSPLLVKDLGIRYELPTTYQHLEWERQGYWTTFPPEHLGSLNGEVNLDQHLPIPAYRVAPRNNWAMDYRSFYYDGLPKGKPDHVLPFWARASKENIYRYTLRRKDGKGIEVRAPANLSCRLFYNSAGRLTLNTNHLLDYASLSWGNRTRQKRLDKSFAGEVMMQVLE